MKKQLTGVVVNTLNTKTAKVQVTRRWTHPLYKKTITKRKNYLVHNEKTKLTTGDKVIIQETTPISKKKRFQVVKKI
ncbi:30S ribosomal protein S17 [Patescibacteria group bacterium]